MKTDKEKAIEKIKKCLKLAGDSAAEGNEVANALRQAQSLMEKHNIDMADVELSDVVRFNQKAKSKSKPARWEIYLAGVVSKAFGCKNVFNSDWNSADWVFIGVGIQPQLAGYAFAVLARQLNKDRTAYIKEKCKRCSAATKRSRAIEFNESWIYAVDSKIAAFAGSEESNKVIAAYMEKHYSDCEKLKPTEQNVKSRDSGAASSAGYSAGKQANLNRPVSGGGNANKQLGVDNG